MTRDDPQYHQEADTTEMINELVYTYIVFFGGTVGGTFYEHCLTVV